MIEQITLALFSALAYSIIFYVKKNKPKQPEEFNKYKLTSTLVVGLAVGVAYAYSGTEVTQQRIETQLVLYSGTVALVQGVIQIVYRRIIEPKLDN